jgi:cyclase
MCNKAHSHHPYNHSHAHSHVRNHDSGQDQTSRRDFLRVLMGGALAGASVMELAFHRAAWASAATPAEHDLFDLVKAAPGVYFAHARPQTMINCNAAIFVRSKDVVVVDAHSKPSAASAIIRQIRRQVTEKPVRYIINTHFHWDHTQGDNGYKQTGDKVDLIATTMTKDLMEKNCVARMKESADSVPPGIEAMRRRAEKAKTAAEKAFCQEQIRQMQAYLADLKQNYELVLPTITFDKSYLLADPAFDLHLEFHGRSHTAGDTFVYCPQQRAIATGDASHGWLPNIGDGYPRAWPATIDEVSKADFKYILGGHGPMQSDRTIMTCQRNYIEELTEKVEAGKKAGQGIAELQKQLTVASLKSMQSNGYQAFLERTRAAENLHFGPMSPLQGDVNGNIGDIYRNLDRA